MGSLKEARSVPDKSIAQTGSHQSKQLYKSQSVRHPSHLIFSLLIAAVPCSSHSHWGHYSTAEGKPETNVPTMCGAVGKVMTGPPLGNHQHQHLRIAELEGTLLIIRSSPCQGGTVGNRTPDLWLHGGPQPLFLVLNTQ